MPAGSWRGLQGRRNLICCGEAPGGGVLKKPFCRMRVVLRVIWVMMNQVLDVCQVKQTKEPTPKKERMSGLCLEDCSDFSLVDL